MKILYFDCFSGISGDMTVGALLDLGVPFDYLTSELEKLGLSGEYRLSLKRTQKCGISANRFDVKAADDAQEHGSHTQSDSCGKEHSCGHEQGHAHHDGQEHGHCEEHTHSHDHRSFADIKEMIEKSTLNDRVKALSLGIFHEVAKAEAKVHETPVEEVAFHEVGAVDSIVDIVGAAVCVDYLKPDKVYVSELSDGTGFVKCQHGNIPVPVPAVLEIAKNTKLSLRTTDIKTELVTPTGAAIAGYLKSDGKPSGFKVLKTGYGAGKKDFADRPNLLRAVLGLSSEEEKNSVSVIETNIDNMPAEGLGFAMEKLFDAGALDVFYTSIYMKKNRPAVKLSVIARENKEQELTDLIFKHTTTIGIRKYKAARVELDRSFEEVETKYGKVRVKACTYNGETKKTPEFEDIKKICDESGLSYTKVYDTIKKYIEY